MKRSCSFQPSTQSASSSSSSLQDICRFCFCEEQPDSPLISPCHCTGSIRYVHQSCLQQWIKTSQTRFCELCRFHFIMHLKVKPLRKWEMSPLVERQLLCTIFILFYFIAFAIGYGSKQYESTKQNVHDNFWRYVELIVDTLMLFCMRIYLCLLPMSLILLFWWWKIINSIIYVENAPQNTTQGRNSSRMIRPLN